MLGQEEGVFGQVRGEGGRQGGDGGELFGGHETADLGAHRVDPGGQLRGDSRQPDQG